MRILHVDTGREMRGGQWQALYLAEGLAGRGHECVLLARGRLYEAARTRGLKVQALSRATFWLAREWSEADLVHVHDARAHTLAAFTATAPFIVSRRVAFPPRTGLLSRWKYGRAEHFIAVSDCVRAKLERAGIPAGKISVVYDGVPLSGQASGCPPSLEQARQPLPHGRGSADVSESRPSGSGPGAPGRIVAPATSDPRKGSALLREAAALGNFEVQFSESLAADLRNAAAFVYITHEEGLGSAALLAMAAGVPVVASRAGGLPEVVVDGETGVLVENTPAAIAAAVRRVTGDRTMGERGRRRVIERFSADAMIENTLAVYHRVLACSRP